MLQHPSFAAQTSHDTDVAAGSGEAAPDPISKRRSNHESTKPRENRHPADGRCGLFVTSAQLGVAQDCSDGSGNIHDYEQYVLAAIKFDRWLAEDAEIDTMLAELREEVGKPPSITHLMRDDTPVGEIGIPEVQKMRGWEIPLMNEIPVGGMNLLRMYTEPSCTPRRAAVITGHHAVCNGM
ncbi:MAG: hypothetical protein AAGC86_04900 [Pseudomonadota bacterium]